MLRFILVFCLGLLIVSCSPRGESKSVDQVYNLARQRFDRALQKARLEESKRQVIGNIRALTQDFVDSDSSQVLAELLGEELKKITHYCHPNTRTSIFEQIETAETLKNAKAVAPNLRFLLAARVLNILAAELETHQFSYTFSG